MATHTRDCKREKRSSSKRRSSLAFVALLTIATTTGNETRGAEDCAGAYSFEERWGSWALDGSGGEHPARLWGDTGRTADGRLGAAAELRTSRAKISIEGIDLSGAELSIVLWARAAEGFVASNARLSVKGSSPLSQNNFWTLETTSDRGLRFFLKTTGGVASTAAAGPFLDPGRWTHIALTYDGARIAIFVDGEVVATAPARGAIVDRPDVGAWLGNSADFSTPFLGRIDEVSFLRRALEPAEIEKAMTAPAPASIDREAPSAPFGLHATFVGCDSIDLAWSESTDDAGIAGYIVLRDGIDVETTTTHACSARELVPGASHAWSIVALDPRGNRSLPSESLVVTTSVAEAADVLLVCGFDFEPAPESPNLVRDISGHARNGRLEMAATFAAGRCGGGVRVDGSRARVLAEGIDVPGEELTIVAWVRPDSLTRDFATLVAKESAPGGSGLFWALESADRNALRARLRTRNGTASIESAAALLEEGRWTHLAATYDGADFVLYVDGVREASSPLSGALLTDRRVPLAIGSASSDASGFHGTLDDVYIVARALGPEEIRSLSSECGRPAGTGALPSPPTAVDAAPLANGTVMISWSGASAASKWFGFRILRDGIVVGASLEPAWLDPLPRAGVHEYSIVTVDAALNESSPSGGALAAFVGAEPPGEEEGSATPSAGIVSDDFQSGGLDPSVWRVVDPAADGDVALTGTGTSDARLAIHVPSGAAHDPWVSGNAAVRVLQDVADLDFDIIARFESSVTRGYQLQGIFVEEDSDTFLRFEVHSTGTSSRLFGALIHDGSATVFTSRSVASDGRLEMRVRREGDHFTWERRAIGGDAWILVAEVDVTLAVTAVGPYAGNAGANPPEHTALIDFVFDALRPIFPEDGAESSSGGDLPDPPPPEEEPEESPPPVDPDPTEAPGEGPRIAVWYGSEQEYGLRGLPQPWYNVLGNVSDPDGVSSLAFRLNGGAERALGIGPDRRRLADPGDFNIDLHRSELAPGANAVVIRAIDTHGNESSATVTVWYDDTIVAPDELMIDWSRYDAVTGPAQVVDGKWAIERGELRTKQVDYDRLVAIGDIDWTDYEATVTITVHSIDPDGYLWPSNRPAVGLALRWPGHTPTGGQPSWGFIPLGAIGWQVFREAPPQNLQLLGGNLGQSNRSFTLEPGIPYAFKMRVETLPGTGPLYRLKVWREDGPEPETWTIEREEPLGAIEKGCLLLVAHHVDASFGPVRVVPARS